MTQIGIPRIPKSNREQEFGPMAATFLTGFAATSFLRPSLQVHRPYEPLIVNRNRGIHPRKLRVLRIMNKFGSRSPCSNLETIEPSRDCALAHSLAISA